MLDCQTNLIKIIKYLTDRVIDRDRYRYRDRDRYRDTDIGRDRDINNVYLKNLY